jgi:hypothetical protein
MKRQNKDVVSLFTFTSEDTISKRQINCLPGVLVGNDYRRITAADRGLSSTIFRVAATAHRNSLSFIWGQYNLILRMRSNREPTRIFRMIDIDY